MSARPDRRHDDVVAAVLPSFAAVLAALCLSLVLAYLTLLAPGEASLIALGAGTSALALSAVALCGRAGWIPNRWAHPATAFALIVVAVNSGAAQALTGDTGYTAVAMLAVVGAGIALVDPRWLGGCVATTWAVWLVAVFLGMPADGGWAPYAVGMGLATIMAIGAHLVRRSDLRALNKVRELAEAAAVRDPLTGLANRRGVAMLGAQILETARRQGDAVHCVFVDVDDFRQINDRLGADSGDEVLVAVSDALRAVTRGTDVVARWSGDEFCVVGPGTGMSPMELERRVRDRLLVHEAVDADVWDPRISAGSAMLAPWDGGTLDTVLGHAGQAMHQRRAMRRRATQTGDQRNANRMP